MEEIKKCCKTFQGNFATKLMEVNSTMRDRINEHAEKVDQLSDRFRIFEIQQDNLALRVSEIEGGQQARPQQALPTMNNPTEGGIPPDDQGRIELLEKKFADSAQGQCRATPGRSHGSA